MYTRSCWACKDSRAVCDRAYPCCSRCTKTSRTCRYGLRLSWPHANNTKRSLTHTIQDESRISHRFSQANFVNATNWDIELHDYLWTSQGLRGHEGLVIKRPNPAVALSWLPIQLGSEDRELLDHFQCTGSSTLAVFGPDRVELFGLLLRLALSDNSPSSVAVLQSALALSSLHRYGPQSDALRLKARALRALITSGKLCIESSEIVQHIAAGMLLCQFEILDTSIASTQWYCHLIEAKNLVQHTGLGSHKHNGEFSRLVDWVDYHTVMSSFSLQHWLNTTYMHQGGAVSDDVRNKQPEYQKREIKGVFHCSHEILQLLYVMFETLLRPTHLRYHSREYERSLQCLESKINGVTVSIPESASNDTFESKSQWTTTLELHKLAALIYLKRASRNFSGASVQIDALVGRAMEILSDLETFHLAFPLLIIGCEARCDDRRKSLLELIERTMESSCLGSLLGLRSTLQRLWVQDDLAIDHELDYLKKLDAVIASYHIMPSFA